MKNSNKNQEYWKKRAEEVAAIQFNKVDDYIFRMNHEYQEALDSINKDIEVFYKRFAQNNGISLSEARRSLNSNQLNEFKMDLAEFTRKAKSNTNQLWENELNNVSCKVRITRLQALQIQINNKIQELYSKHQVKGIDILKDIYKDTYYRNMYEIQRGIGIASSFARIDNNALDKVINEKWREGNYSSRVWANKGKLLLELQTNLSQSFIRGDSVDKTAKVIGSRLNVDRNRARTVVNTESAYITQKATFDSYGASGVVKQYEILATLDLHTSDICREIDGKIFNLADKEIGITAPPFHPNCRTTTIAYFDDAVDEERIARDSDGKQYYVDGNMSYKDWYSKHVKDNPKEELSEKKIKNKSSDKQEHEKYKEILGNQAPKSFDKFQELKYNNVNEWEKIKIRHDIKSGKYNLSLNKEAYEKHIEGHKRFDDYRDRLRSKGSTHVPSSLTVTYDEAQDLIKKYAGTGEIISNRGQIKELIRGNDKLVGIYRDVPSGIEERTANFSIHYSKSDKKGAHIVPMKEG